ncbi:hypothetical protein, partial [Lysinibacillus fusiformis]
EKHENNPFLKGKILVSKSTKHEYDTAVTERNRFKDLLQTEGIKGKKDFKNQVDLIKEELETKVPEHENQIQSFESGLGLFEAVMSGVRQAGTEMTRARNKKSKIRNEEQNKFKNRTGINR